MTTDLDRKVAAIVRATTAACGVPEKLEDPTAAQRLAVLLDRREDAALGRAAPRSTPSVATTEQVCVDGTARV